MPPVEGNLATLPRTRSFAPFPCLSGKVLHKTVDPVLLAYISKRDDLSRATEWRSCPLLLSHLEGAVGEIGR
jgi:hypothetical protein